MKLTGPQRRLLNEASQDLLQQIQSYRQGLLKGGSGPGYRRQYDAYLKLINQAVAAGYGEMLEPHELKLAQPQASTQQEPTETGEEFYDRVGRQRGLSTHLKAIQRQKDIAARTQK